MVPGARKRRGGSSRRQFTPNGLTFLCEKQSMGSAGESVKGDKGRWVWMTRLGELRCQRSQDWTEDQRLSKRHEKPHRMGWMPAAWYCDPTGPQTGSLSWASSALEPGWEPVRGKGHVVNLQASQDKRSGWQVLTLAFREHPQTTHAGTSMQQPHSVYRH